jgi:hypothetical protein
MSTDICHICQVSVFNDDNEVKLECNHHICLSCVRILIKMAEQRCPFCRSLTVRLFLSTQNSRTQLQMTDCQLDLLTRKIDDLIEISSQFALKPPPYSYLIAKVSQHLGYDEAPQHCTWNPTKKKKWEKWWDLIISRNQSTN